MHERRNIEMNDLCSDPVVTLLGVPPARDPSRRNVTVFKNVKCENKNSNISQTSFISFQEIVTSYYEMMTWL